MSTVVELEIFSPRWGHDDTYRISFEKDVMEISMQARKCTLTWVEGRDPEWSGQSLESIMANDHIYPPAITADLFEHAWKAWRSGDINNQQVLEELILVAEWVNIITRAKPQSNFWKKYF